MFGLFFGLFKLWCKLLVHWITLSSAIDYGYRHHPKILSLYCFFSFSVHLSCSQFDSCQFIWLFLLVFVINFSEVLVGKTSSKVLPLDAQPWSFIPRNMRPALHYKGDVLLWVYITELPNFGISSPFFATRIPFVLKRSGFKPSSILISSMLRPIEFTRSLVL